jgi:hypothetical protein
MEKNQAPKGHMDVTFQPIFSSVPFRDLEMQAVPAVRHPPPPGGPVFNLIGKQASILAL